MTPNARRDGVVYTEVNGDVVVYDADRKRAHALNPTAAFVWRACDGQHTLEDIEARLRAEVDPGADAMRALEELEEAGLLEQTPEPQAGISRRRAMKRMGAAALAPAVVSILLPSAVQAQGGTCGQVCCDDSECPSSCPTCVNKQFCPFDPGVCH